ncbi:MAG: TIGR00730 family Rossman fold protein [Betaproteobacteria bacterium]
MTAPSHEINNVCVFCGSQPGGRPEYLAAARELGSMLARNGVGIVYGGGHIGMMGALADAALAANGRVAGVIPEHLMRPEVAHQRLSELVVVDTMHTRKRLMAERSDAFVVLPGGYGTFEEMFEMVTWLQLKLHTKPVGILNVENYFDHLLQFLRHAAAEGFIRPAHFDLVIVESGAPLLLERLRRHTPTVSRGVTLDQLDRS